MKPLQHKKHTLAKRGLSLLCILALCLGLLPTAALAAEDAPDKLYVGNQSVRNGDNTTYWKTNDSGELTQSNEDGTWNVKYNPGTATLTLNEAKISGSYDEYNNPFTAGIYAKGSSNQAVALTIELIGTNTITGCYGIYLDGHQGNTICTNASVLIKNGNDSGESGSLTVNGTSNHGIYILSGTGNASLTIENASVVANTNSSYGGSGVFVQSGASSKDSPQLSLAVNGGSLTTSASEGNDGIQFYVGAYEATSATTSLTVTNHAIVDARNGGISVSGVSVNPELNIGSTDSTGGIVWNGTEGTVYGNVTLDESLTINQGETLTIGKDASLTVPDGKNLTNNGTILVSGGTLSGDTTLTTPNITEQPYDDTVTEGEVATFTVEASAGSETLTYQWQQSTDNGSSWTNIERETNASYTINSTNTSMNGYKYRCVVKSASGVSVISQTATLTVQAKPASVPVTDVSLDKDTLSLYTGDTASLTATVEPENATNPAVIWSSSDSSIVTVGADQTDNTKATVKALKEGSATITATAADGSGKSDTCTVTVKEPPYTGKYSYELSTSVGDHGSLTVDRYATEGDKVTIAVMPDEAYKLDDLSVTAGGKDVELTDNHDGTYTFTMPSADVKITATFAEDPDWTPDEPEEPTTDVSDIFLDVAPNAWYRDAVQYAYDSGLMTGVSANEFAPEATTTRAMIVSMLARLEGVESANNAGFADVSNEWYATAVSWAANVGVVNGYEDSTFRPNTAITREQLAAILMNYAQYKGQDVSARADLNGYTDQPSTWAEEAISWSVAEGLLTGVTADTLQPQGAATRAQVAAILQRFLSE